MEKNENLKYYSLTRMTPYGVTKMFGVYGNSEDDALRRYAEQQGLFSNGWVIEPLSKGSRFNVLRLYLDDGTCRAELHAELSKWKNSRIYQ